jgi:hypothetical protein
MYACQNQAPREVQEMANARLPDGQVMITVKVSRDVAEMLDRYQKRVSAGRWRRHERITKRQIVEEALRRYIAAEAGPGKR